MVSEIGTDNEHDQRRAKREKRRNGHIKSKDEIGHLAQAIGRMQTSLRLAMSRLRKKR